MIHIAILDDDILASSKMENQINVSTCFKEIEYSIEKFENPKEIAKPLNEYDVFFLDIDMPNTDGISVANEIRKLSQTAIIIFVTSRNDLMHMTFSVQPFYFIRKSHYKEDCSILFTLLLERLKNMKRNVLISFAGKKKVVKLSSIVFIESFNHEIAIHLENSEVLTINKKISEMLLEINDECLIQIHKSYLINLTHVDYLKGNILMLRNGISFPIGRKYKHEVYEKHERYLLL